MKNHDLIRQVMSKRKKWRSHEIFWKFIEERKRLGKDMVSQSNMERRLREMNDVRCEKDRHKPIFWYSLVK